MISLALRTHLLRPSSCFVRHDGTVQLSPCWDQDLPSEKGSILETEKEGRATRKSQAHLVSNVTMIFSNFEFDYNMTEWQV